MPRTIAILGTGLIGASLGLALGTADPEQSPLGRCHIVGYDPDRIQARLARTRLALDADASSAAAAVKEADIVIIATPVQRVPEVMREIAPHLRYGALVMDVCSTKGQVMRWARELLPTSVSFVGGHPMAGSERSGAESAQVGLFEGAVFCLCPAVQARAEAVDIATAMVETIGSKPYFIDPDEHDAYVAAVSHLPFVMSSALIETVSRSPAWNEFKVLASSGLRDVSRLASGDPIMHRDICLTNRASITHWINEMIRMLVEVRGAIEEESGEQLLALLKHAQHARDAWVNSPEHARPGEGRPMTREELAPPSIGSLLFGNPANIVKLRKKKDNTDTES